MSETGGPSHQATVLDDVRRALGRTEAKKPAPLAPFVEIAADADTDELLARLIREATAVGVRFYEAASGDDVGDVIAQICGTAGVVDVALSGSGELAAWGLAARLAARRLTVVEAVDFGAGDKERLVARLATCDAGVTTVEYAIAETGTLVVTSAEEQALLVSLLPPVHIAVLRPRQILDSLTTAVGKLAGERMRWEPACPSVTFITGPSRTSDVELTLSIGVHGPKELHVIVLAE